MKYLIDTHVLIWWLERSDKLSGKVMEIIGSNENQIVVSVVSIWEISIKTRLGKLETPDDLMEMISIESFEVLDIKSAHALQVKELPLHHHDPFDHLLIAQSIQENLPMITRDKYFDSYEIETIW